jgi:hypothetical protein
MEKKSPSGSIGHSPLRALPLDKGGIAVEHVGNGLVAAINPLDLEQALALGWTEAGHLAGVKVKQAAARVRLR